MVWSLIYVTCLVPAGTWDFNLWSKPLWHVGGEREGGSMPACVLNVFPFGSSTMGNTTQFDLELGQPVLGLEGRQTLLPIPGTSEV